MFGIYGFINGFNAAPGIWTKDKDGKIVYGNIQPEFKAGLGKLRELYMEGLVDREYAVKDQGKVAEAVLQGKIGMFYGVNWIPLYPLQGLRDKDPNADWVALPLPSLDGSPTKPVANNDFDFYYAVKKGYKNPEVLVKLFNYYFEKAYGKSSETQYDRFFGGDSDPSPEKDSKHNSVVMPGSPTKDYAGYTALKEALISKDTSKLSAEYITYYDTFKSSCKAIKRNGSGMHGWHRSKVRTRCFMTSITTANCNTINITARLQRR